MNRVILSGELVSEPTHYAYDNKEPSDVLFVRLRTNETWTGKDGKEHGRSEIHTLVLPKRFEHVAKNYMAKGRKLLVEGKLRINSYVIRGQKLQVCEIEVQYFEFLDEKLLVESKRIKQDDDMPF